MKKNIYFVSAIVFACVTLSGCMEKTAQRYGSLEELAVAVSDAGQSCPIETANKGLLADTFDSFGMYVRSCESELSIGWFANSLQTQQYQEQVAMLGFVTLQGPNWSIFGNPNRLSDLESLKSKLGGEIFK